MAPFTPFFCEAMYQNLRKALPEDAPQSVHWCDFPEAAQAQVRISASLSSLSAVIAVSTHHLTCPVSAEALLAADAPTCSRRAACLAA